MYHRFVERRVRATFRQFSSGDWQQAVAQLPDDVEHVFPGDHALGGVRHTKLGVQQWFERLYTIFPDLHFEVTQVLVQGWPWDTHVAVQWVDRATPPDGIPYLNHGTHVLRLQRGRLVSLRAYCDTQQVALVCDRLAARGLAIAAAPPITT